MTEQLIIDPRFKQVPGTDFIVLAAETCALTPWALANGSIIGEKAIEGLAEVKALTPGKVVIDCGAMIGDTALIFLNQGCEVHAFEAYEDAFTALKHNCPTAHAYNVAVGDGRPAHAGGVFGEPNKNHGTRMVSPGGEPSLRIDDLNLPRVDFGKYDVEGFEKFALEGSRETILRCKPVLLVEIYDRMLRYHGACRQDIIDFMASVGYSWSVAIGRWEDERLDIVCKPLE